MQLRKEAEEWGLHLQSRTKQDDVGLPRIHALTLGQPTYLWGHPCLLGTPTSQGALGDAGDEGQ